MAVSIHTVTAYLYNGLAARPFWNSAILAPRFLASAFCSGPAILLILLQILRKTTRLEIKDEAIFKIAELMAYTMGFNLFLTAAEAFKEFYSNTEDVVFIQYLYFGFRGHYTLVPFAWASIICGLVAFLLFLIPTTRKNWVTLNIGCVLIYSSVYIEKGMGLIIPGLTPDTLGRDLRLQALHHRGHRGRWNLRRRLPRLHPHAEDRRPHDARRIHHLQASGGRGRRRLICLSRCTLVRKGPALGRPFPFDILRDRPDSLHPKRDEACPVSRRRGAS